MKMPSSGLGVGLWAVGGLVAIYLLGAVWVYNDRTFMIAEYHPKGPPNVVRNIAVFLYYPFFEFLNRLGLI